MKKKSKRISILILTAVGFIGCGLIMVFSGADKLVTLTPNQAVIPTSALEVVCTLKNNSIRTVTYGDQFSLEHWTGNGWETANESGSDINFQLGARKLFPFTSIELTYLTSIFSMLQDDELYRIVITVQYGKSSSLALFCPFTVE